MIMFLWTEELVKFRRKGMLLPVNVAGWRREGMDVNARSPTQSTAQDTVSETHWSSTLFFYVFIKTRSEAGNGLAFGLFTAAHWRVGGCVWVSVHALLAGVCLPACMLSHMNSHGGNRIHLGSGSPFPARNNYPDASQYCCAVVRQPPCRLHRERDRLSDRRESGWVCVCVGGLRGKSLGVLMRCQTPVGSKTLPSVSFC